MKQLKGKNVRDTIWKIIDTDISLKNDLGRQVINVRALALYLINTYKLGFSVDSVISAIRRYAVQSDDKKRVKDVFDLLKKSEIKTITSMASMSLKKNEEVTQKLGKVLPSIRFEKGETLRILEGSKIFKIIINQRSFQTMHELFKKKNILDIQKKIGMIEMIYPKILPETPGVFAVVSNELGEKGISIVDALICSNEHIFTVYEKDLLIAFSTLYELCN